MVEEYIEGILIYRLCNGVDRMEGYSRLLMWWQQEHNPKQKERGAARNRKHV